jgi:hypothetical protein
MSNQFASAVSRRAFLGQTAMGTLGLLALADLLRAETPTAAARTAFQPRLDHPPTAKNVICLFQNGGPSQMDLFDPKPALNRLDGKPAPDSVKIESIMNIQNGKLMGTPFKFDRCGRSGAELSEIIPHTHKIADDITLVRSMVADTVCHEAAIRQWVGGNAMVLGRPSVGSWIQYGLGSLNENLPAYVVLPDPDGPPVWGPDNWTNGWLPAIYQGTPILSGGAAPVLNLKPQAGVQAGARSRQLKYLDQLNRRHLVRYAENAELEARISNFEMAARMQTSVPSAVDLSQESAETKALYGLDSPATERYAARTLMARRLVENGVRYVGVYLSGQPWDTHSNNASETKRIAAGIDQPSAALVQDLKRRGMLDSTIVIWLGEFGRTPISEGAAGRDHSRSGFSMWIAGGGFKAGYVHGATDDIGYRAVDNALRFCDLHATLLHALGIDHTKLTYPHDGRLESLTDHEVTGATLVPELLA